MNHGDPKNPKKNPHPVKRYEVIATSDAPGPWDSVKGSLRYEVTNPECTPENSYVGVHNVPRAVLQDIKMTQVSDTTWRGYFYQDLLQDQNYFGLGACHWSATQVAPIFTVHEAIFGSAQLVNEALKASQTIFFKKADFLDRSLKPDALQDFSPVRPEVVQHPEIFFSITVSLKEAKA
jgi:hypothetical protein